MRCLYLITPREGVVARLGPGYDFVLVCVWVLLVEVEDQADGVLAGFGPLDPPAGVGVGAGSTDDRVSGRVVSAVKVAVAGGADELAVFERERERTFTVARAG